MIFERLFESRMTSAPGGSLQEPDRTIMQALGAMPTLAGVPMNEMAAEGIPAVYACVRVIAETVGQVPLEVFQRQAGGNKTPDPTHPLYPLLHDAANPEMTASEYREMLTGHACLWGNGFAEVQRRKSGTVQALWPLHPGAMAVDRGPDNRLRYTYSKPGVAEPIVYHWDPVATPIFHLRYNGGRSPIRVLREHLATSKALELYYAALFGNGSRPGGVLQSKDPVKLTEPQIQSLRNQWQELHRGVGNAHKLAILPAGLQWQAVGMPPEDAQLVELLNLHIEQAASIWRVPLFMVQHTEKSTSWGTGIESLGIAFTNFTMLPWFNRWQQAIARDLIAQPSQQAYGAGFDIHQLSRGDMKSMSEALAAQRQNGVINANDWLRQLGMNTRDDQEAEEYWRPVNYVPADTPPAVSPAPNPAPTPTGASA